MKNQIILIVILSFFMNFANAQWQQINGFYVGTLNCIAISGNNIFAGTYGGVYLSTNNGNSWAKMNTGLTNLSVKSLALSHSSLAAVIAVIEI